MTAVAMSQTPATPLDVIFRARSVAFVGVSADPHKLSGFPLRLLLMHKFAGRVFCVNPKHKEIEGVPCAPTIAELPEAVDTAFISLPAAAVPQAVDELGARGVRSAVILSSGFDEVRDGAPLAARLREAAQKHGMLIVGPNSEGIWSVPERLILTFGSAARRDVLVQGRIAVVSQSGAIGGGLVRQLQDGGWGLSYFVSTGNESILSVMDYLEWLVEQDDTDVVLLFLEGLRDGARLPAIAARAAERGIRIVVLKSGDSEAGRQATATHTGKISSRAAVYRDIFRQCGIPVVSSLSELLETGQVLANLPLPPSRARPGAGLTVVSVPGGTRALMADQCEALGIPLATFEPETVAALDAELPAFAVSQNPIDLTGEVLRRTGMLARALDLVAEDPNTEAVIVQLGNGALRDIVEKRDIFTGFASRHRMPLAVSFLGDVLAPEERAELARQGVWCTRDCYDAVAAMGRLFQARRAVAQPPKVAVEPGALSSSNWVDMACVIEGAGVPLSPWKLLRPGDDAGAVLQALGGEVAVKALPEDAPHKTELGLLHLGLRSADAVEKGAAAIRKTLGRPDAAVLVQAMAPAGLELLLTVTNDPDFGPILTVGAGGTDVEMLEDAANCALPASRQTIRDLFLSLRTARKYDGWRGSRPYDMAAAIDAAEDLGRVALSMPGNWRSIEINPLRVLHKGAMALDALVETV